jgi:hypothetical protein
MFLKLVLMGVAIFSFRIAVTGYSRFFGPVQYHNGSSTRHFLKSCMMMTLGWGAFVLSILGMFSFFS